MTSNQLTARLGESYADLERKLDERTAELSNSLEQQTAINEILRVISSSPTDVQPVLDTVAERAAHLCRDSPGFFDRNLLKAIQNFIRHLRAPILEPFTFPVRSIKYHQLLRDSLP
jgi:hypothetical protein